MPEKEDEKKNKDIIIKHEESGVERRRGSDIEETHEESGTERRSSEKKKEK